MYHPMRHGTLPWWSQVRTTERIQNLKLSYMIADFRPTASCANSVQPTMLLGVNT